MDGGKGRQGVLEFKLGLRFYVRSTQYACRDEALLFFFVKDNKTEKQIKTPQTSNTLQEAPTESQILTSLYLSHCLILSDAAS